MVETRPEWLEVAKVVPCREAELVASLVLRLCVMVEPPEVEPDGLLEVTELEAPDVVGASEGTAELEESTLAVLVLVLVLVLVVSRVSVSVLEFERVVCD